MAYKVIILYQLYMPSYFLGTFTEYPFSAIKEMIRYSNNRIKIGLSPLPPENIEAIVSADRIREFRDWLNR